MTSFSTLRNLLILTLCLLTGLAVALYLSPEKSNTNGLNQLGGEFTLESAEGKVSLSDYRGKVVAMYIGYASCPDVCPTSLAIMSQALKNLSPEDAAQVQSVFISVDPERDTPEKLAQYSKFFFPTMVGLTGERTAIDDIVKRYGAFYKIVDMGDSAMGYAVDHSSRTYLIDQRGQFSKALSHGTSPDDVALAIRELLAQG
ncbi:SCO family protein [Aliamphritea ceti]|uniref:SCO family protein n=1 Tax=Aliamphritea ceti TaxID=1524258 RepID=UPI0021C44B12|nr:SCO family protein [Aliamphritea ceti]